MSLVDMLLSSVVCRNTFNRLRLTLFRAHVASSQRYADPEIFNPRQDIFASTSAVMQPCPQLVGVGCVCPLIGLLKYRSVLQHAELYTSHLENEYTFHCNGK